MNVRTSGLIVGTVASFGTSPLHAQASQPLPAESASVGTENAPSANAGGVADIVVTAERRAISLQRIPVAAAALTDADLEARAIVNVNNLQSFTPSLSITETGLQRFVNIRGVGQSASLPGVQNGIVYNVDGIFTRSALNEVPFYDLERVEVLRGPQGTLSGQNATGGAINVVTRAPTTGETSGYSELTYGNYNHVIGEAALNVPLSDNLAVRAAVYGESRDSFYKSINPPGTATSAPPPFTPGDLNRFAARLSVLAKPTDNLSITVRGEYYKRTSDGYAFKPVPGDPTVIFNGVNSAAVTPPDPFTIDYDAPGKADLRIQRVYGEARWDFTDRLQLRSLTSYLDAVSDSIQDQDGNGSTPPLGVGSANVRPFVVTQHIHTTTFTQELNLLTTGAGPLQGVLGAYYYDLRNPSTLVNATIQVQLPVSQTKGEAVFGQLTYAISDKLKLTGGLRYNHDEGRAAQILTIRSIGAIIPASPSYKSNALTGKVTLEYEPTTGQFLYATASRGYKSGGTNNPPLPSFNPEYVWNYEGGVKSSFFGNQLRTQVDVFYDTYRDYQVNIFDPSPAINGQIVKNGSDARLYGLEGQAQLKVSGFSGDATVSYIHSEFVHTSGGNIFAAEDVRYPVGNAARGPIIVTGLRLPFAQEWTASIGGQYDLLVGRGTLTPRVQVSYNGDQWASIFEKAFDYIPARHTVDLRLTYAQDHWSLAGYATNVGNKTYVTGKFNGFQYNGAPREFGMKARYAF